MFKETIAHRENTDSGQPTIKVGRTVPSNAVNLAYYHNPMLHPKENVYISDVGDLISENIIAARTNELIMYPDEDGVLHLNGEAVLNSRHVEITDRFKDKTPLYYRYKLKEYFFSPQITADSIVLQKANGQPLYGDKYKYKVDIIPVDGIDNVYNVYIYTSFLASISSKIVCLYNALKIKEDGSKEIVSGHKERINPQPFLHNGTDFFLDAKLGPVAESTITVPLSKRYIDNRDLIKFKYTISTSNGQSTGEVEAYVTNIQYALDHELKAFTNEGQMCISPYKNGRYLSAKEIVQDHTGATDEDLKDALYYVKFVDPGLVGNKVSISVSADGFMPPMGFTMCNTGVNENDVMDMPEVYTHLSGGEYVKGYSVKMKDHRQISALTPVNTHVLENWYPRIQQGYFERQGYDLDGKQVKLVYTLGKFNTKEYSFNYGFPYVEVKGEKAIVINNHLLRVKHSPLYIKVDEDTRKITNLKVIKVNSEGQSMECVVEHWDSHNGLIEVLDIISDNDNIHVDYVFEEVGVTYTGYTEYYAGTSEQMMVDLNPNQYHVFDSMIHDDDNVVIGHEERPTRDLFNMVMSVFIKPAVIYNADGDVVKVSKPEDIIYHNYTNTPDDYNDIQIANIYLRHNTTIDNMKIIDVRQRGGGVIEEMFDHVRSAIEPESDYYMDIGYWDGEPYNENAVVIVRVDDKILSKNNGQFDKQEIEAAVHKWCAMGTLPIIEYVHTFGIEDSPNGTLKVEKTYSNLLDEKPLMFQNIVKHVKLGSIELSLKSNKEKPYGIISVIEDGVTDDVAFYDVVNNSLSAPSINNSHTVDNSESIVMILNTIKK